MQDLANTLHLRLMCLLKRRALLKEPSESNQEKQLDDLSACGQVAPSHGKRARRGPALSLVDEDDLEHPRHGISASVDGLNVYASAPLDGRDRELMERVWGYLLRGPLAQKRLSQRPDGMLAYRLKKPDRRGNTVLVLSPQGPLMRLGSLVPAPGHPSRKYLGILGGGAKDRSKVVPTPTRRKLGQAHARRVEPVASRVNWEELLRRLWGLEALECARCGGRMTPMAVVEDPEEVARYLAHTGDTTLHQRARAPPDWVA